CNLYKEKYDVIYNYEDKKESAAMDRELNTKMEAFEDGVLTRMQGYNKYFNPFRNTDNEELYKEWQKGWTEQHLVMLN
ncbi:hypothetical protein, partial [Vibrio parahaemolyticus]|uniref:hypothetical protein n=2 Tax=Vibrionaceae TaxID=641 RepID=UPI001E4ACAFA